jgi:hypothetical protein
MIPQHACTKTKTKLADNENLLDLFVTLLQQRMYHLYWHTSQYQAQAQSGDAQLQQVV